MSAGRRLGVLVVLLLGALVFSGVPAHANYPDPPEVPGQVRPMATDVAPPNCVGTAPTGTVPTGTNVSSLCQRSATAAANPFAAAALRFGFSKLGTPYSQDYVLRGTSHFDCSSFVGRAYNAAGGQVRRTDGRQVDFWPYFGWTGAYVAGGTNYGYRDTNVERLSSKSQLRPGDIIIQFNGTDPSKSMGNAGHALLYLADGLVLHSGGAPDGSSRVGVSAHRNSFSTEWYFRYQPVSASKPDPAPSPVKATPTPTPTPTPVKPTPTPTLKAGQPVPRNGVVTLNVGTPNSTVIGTIGITGAQQSGVVTAYPCAAGRPATITLSFRPGREARITTYVRSDRNAQVCVYTSQAAHMTFDRRLVTPVMAIHKPVTRVTSLTPSSRPLAAARKLIRIPTGTPNKTAVGTLTVKSEYAGGFAAIVPCTAPWPGTSTLNYSPGQTVSNTAAAKADARGDICFYTSSPVRFQWDQAAETITIPNAAPKRVFDTRSPSFFGGVPFPAWGQGGFLKVEPNRTVLGNLTVIGADTAGMITFYPCTGAPRPPLASISFAAGERTANYVATTSDAQGMVCIHSTARTHVVWDTIDTTHWYLAQAPTRVLNTAG